MGQPNLNTTIIGALMLPKPSMAEQRQLVDYCVEQVATVDRLITKIEAVEAQLIERRAALISAAVTGKIDVRD
jgi:type I restriction enzyme S subunit